MSLAPEGRAASPLPLQLPDGPELLIVFLVFLLLLVAPGLVLYLVGKPALGSGDRVDDLEREPERERGDDN